MPTSGVGGYSGDGGPADAAELSAPQGLALGGDGSLYITDTGNNRIRKVLADGTITTVAGRGGASYSGGGGNAMKAQLNLPTSVALDRSGDLYIADTENGRIRTVDARGVITTVAGGLARRTGVAVGDDSRLYVANTDDNRVRTVRR